MCWLLEQIDATEFRVPSTCGVAVRAVHLVRRGLQDFAITYKMIHDLWSLRKVSNENAKVLAVHARCLGADRLCSFVDWSEERELAMAYNRKAATLRQQHEDKLVTFKVSKGQLAWQRQYDPATVEEFTRFKALLLVGNTECGKSRKATSIFGHSRTLVVNCQGLGSNLPSLRNFRRSEHSAIVFDEAVSEQVLANKLVFQAGVDELTLSQSACNAHAYKVWLYAVPMILCTNGFQMKSRPDAPMAVEDEEYLAKNIIDGSLDDFNAPWFEKPTLDEADEASDGEQSTGSGEA